MSLINIHTWRCPGCNYSQDFDPLDAAAFKKHFFEDPRYKPKPGLKVGDCPNCLVPLPKETIPSKKAVMRMSEAADIEKTRGELIADGRKKVSTPFKEMRLETEEERVYRVTKSGLPADSPAVMREFRIYRDEETSEMNDRINAEVAELEEAKDVANKKSFYEDKD